MENITEIKEYVSLKEASNTLGVSSATTRNWVKAGYLSRYLNSQNVVFNKVDVIKLKQDINLGKIDKLTKRANKKSSSSIFIPDEYIQNKDLEISLNKILNIYKKNNLEIDKVVLVVALILLKKVQLIKTIKELKLEKIIFKNNFIKKEIFEWFNDLNNLKFNKNYLKILNIDIPLNCDFLGLIYQSLIKEGEKAKKGSYYSPKEVVDEIIKENIKKENIVLDPCCGTGQFLLSVANKTQNPENIWGFDIDNNAVKIARLNLILKFPEKNFFPNIYCLNTLLELDTSSLFLDINIPKFDVIVTNPPWGVHFSSLEKQELQNKYPDIKSNESFSYFLKKSYELLKKGGRLSFILPESILNIKTHRDIRRMLLEDVKLLKIKYLDRLFKNVFTPVIRIDFEKNNPEDNHILLSEMKEFVYKLKQLDFKKNTDYLLNVFIDNRDILLFKKMYDTKHIILKNNADWALGVVTGNNKKHLSEIKQKNFEPILTGKDIKRFSIKTPKTFIDFKPHKFQQVASEDKYRAKEKLLYKFISKYLVFAYDNKQTLALNSANILIPKVPNYSIKTILALFNSSPYQFLYQKKFNAFKLLRSDVEQLPLPILNIKQHKEIKNFMNCIIDKKISDENKKLVYEDVDKYVMSLFSFTKAEQKYILESITNPETLLKIK